MSIAKYHAEWLSLIEVSGPFLSMPVLLRVFPQGLIAHDPEKFRTLKLGYEEWEDNNEAGPKTNPALHPAWIKFVLTNILNPKVALFFLAFLPQFIDSGSPTKVGAFLALGLTFIATGTVWCLFLALAAAHIRGFFASHPRSFTRVPRVSGLLFVLLGLRLAMSER